MLSFFNRKSVSVAREISVVDVLRSNVLQLSQDIASWLPAKSTPALWIAYISPHVDFAQTCQTLKQQMNQLFPKCKLLAVSTSGELCHQPDTSNPLYCDTGNSWNTIVVQSFGQDLLQDVTISAIPLFNDDLKRGEITVSHHDRVQRIAQSLARISVPFPIDHHDTVALTFLDGLSASESFFSEAVYSCCRLPCHFIGGSAGGKFDFQNTYIYDGQQIRQGHAVIAFLKINPAYRYAIFSSHNFEKQNVSFLITEASQEQRWIKSVLTDDNHIISFIDALKKHFRINSDQALEQKMEDYSFAIEIKGQLFILSIASFDFALDRVSFFRDLSIGEQLFLVKRQDLVQCTEQDFHQFMATKTHATPVGGILHDCVLRRLHNPESLSQVHCFDAIPIAGFSTFGELYGINVNQTLTGLFFFRPEKSDSYFYDDSVDLFPILYAQFQNYGLQRQLKKMDILSKFRKEVILKHEHYRAYMPDVTARLDDIERNIRKISQQLAQAEKASVFTELNQQDKTNFSALSSAIETTRAGVERVNEQVKTLERLTRILDYNQK